MINSSAATSGGGGGKEDGVDHAAEGDGDMTAVAETADVNGNCADADSATTAEGATNEQQASGKSNHNVIACPVCATKNLVDGSTELG